MSNGTDRRPEMTSSAKRAGEEADRMIAELAAQKKAATGQPEAEPQPAGETSIVSEPATPQPTQDVGNQSDVGVQPVNQSDEALSLLRKEITAANSRIASADARWQSLQGMVNKKDSEIEQMRLLLAQLSQKAEQPAAPANLVTSKDEDDFGADMVDLGRRVATEVFNQRIKEVIARLDKMEQSISGVSDATNKIAGESFNEALTRQVPNWEATDRDPEFISWLNGEDGFTGRSKLDLLQHAYSSGNLKSTVAIFKTFEAEKAHPTEAKAHSAAEPAANNVVKYVAPGKSKSSATPAVQTTQSKVWSPADISKLYEDKRNKRITEEDFVEQERDLFMAQREGRVAA